MVTFEVRPLGESGLDGRNLEGKRAQKFPSTKLEIPTCPDLAGPRGAGGSWWLLEKLEGRCFSQPREVGWTRCMGGGEVGAIWPGTRGASS